MSVVEKVYLIAWKDLLAEFRTKELLGGMLVFSLLVIVTFNFAFDLSGASRAVSGAGALWIAFLFAGVLGFGRTIATERDRGSLDGLLLCPVDRGILYLGKLASNLIFMLIVEIITVPIFGLLFDLPVYRPMMIAALALGTLGFAGIGTLLATMAAGTKAREVLFPLLLFPVSVPIVIATVRSCALVLSGELTDVPAWLGLTAAFDLIFLTVAFLVFERVVEE